MLFHVVKGTRSLPKILKSVAMRDLPRVIQHSPVCAPSEPVDDTGPSPAQLRLEAEEFLQTAREQAAAVIAQAEAKADHLTAEAGEKGAGLAEQAQERGFQEGYDNGYAEGRQAAQAEMHQALLDAVKKSQDIIALAEREAKDCIIAAEGKIVELAVAVARKILARELENTAEVVLSIAKKALEKVRDQEQIVLRVNSADYEPVLQNRRDLQLILGQEQALTITPDQTIEPGSCMIESSNGTVDARVSTQFEVLEKTLQDIAP